MAEIKVGSIVVLKSGGPRMTVASIAQQQDQMKAWCDWFEDSKQQRGVFPVSSLKLAE